MNLRPVAIVYAKELRELFRDRRTIISMVVVPVVVLPAMMIGLSLLAAKIVGQVRQEIPKVMLMGATNSPQTAAALRASHLFNLVPPAADYTNLISAKKIRAAIQIPGNFDAAVENGETTTVRIFTYNGEIKSAVAAASIEQFFQHRREAIVTQRMAERRLPEKLLTPFGIEKTNVATARMVSGNLIGMILPYMVIIMCLTGAIYPAIDLTAGEKERGTMETLLCSPVARTHLVIGKGLVVLTVSLGTALLSLLANGGAILLVRRASVGAPNPALFKMVLDPASLLAVCALMVPMAIFFSALMLALGLFARSAKEANSYLQPMLILAIVPALASALPGVEMNYWSVFIPVFNVSVASKEMLSGAYHWNYLALVFLVMCAYATAAVMAAVALFNRETVLFRT